MRPWNATSRAKRTGRTATGRAGVRPDRSRCLVVESLESRRLLTVGIREFAIPTANSAPFWITSGPDSSLYFTAGGANQVGAYNPATHGFTAFFVPTTRIGSSSYITAGLDGNLYFTASGTNAIEQLDPATHVITAFPIPTAGLGPQYIATGPDGNLYFTTNANIIEQFDSTTRVFRSFSIPTANSGASGITSGPDKSLWFIESAANKIGQLNPATHVVTEFSIPNAVGGASTITTGPDGNLYFTEPGSNSIGQFNPISHAFRGLPIPVANSLPASITIGADGNLYFTEPGVNEIGRLNLATLHFTQLVIPTVNSGATGITAGPDGNVYFTENNSSKIGEVVLSTRTGTTTQLTVAPNPSVVGQVVNLTATVTSQGGGEPTGTVTFFIDGQAQGHARLALRNGVAQATLSTKLADATHLITSMYKGNSTLAASVSNAESLVVAPAPGDGPTVVHLVRLGFHSLPTTLVLTFDKAINPARAQNPGNYKITDSRGHLIRIGSVHYDPSTLAVTISPASRLDLHRPYHLTVNGTPPDGLTDTSGNLLDGSLSGLPGSNYQATVTALDLVFPAKGRVQASRPQSRFQMIPDPKRSARHEFRHRIATATAFRNPAATL